MATNDIKYVLNVQLADNTVTVENKDDKIAVLVSAGTADFKRVVSEIMEVNPGLERETVEAVLNLEKRVVKKLLLTGFRVNTGGLNASSLKGYNESNIISAIKSGYPVLGRGNSGKKKVLGIRVGWKGGHAWVYDGVLVASKDGKSNNFVHCNWGWGGYKNGYYISKAFDTNAGAPIYDSSDEQSGKTPNYKYNLEYSIVKK
jgi:hypothetical protein